MKWKTYRLGNILQFNPAERLAKGTFAKKVPMDLLQPRTRAISGFEMVSYTGGNKFRNGDTLMARITPCLENGKRLMFLFLMRTRWDLVRPNILFSEILKVLRIVNTSIILSRIRGSGI